MAAQYAYVMNNMTKTFPGAQKPAPDNIDPQFHRSATAGIAGPNGAVIEAVDGWTLGNQLEIAMKAQRCPPSDTSLRYNRTHVRKAVRNTSGAPASEASPSKRPSMRRSTMSHCRAVRCSSTGVPDTPPTQ